MALATGFKNIFIDKALKISHCFYSIFRSCSFHRSFFIKCHKSFTHIFPIGNNKVHENQFSISLKLSSQKSKQNFFHFHAVFFLNIKKSKVIMDNLKLTLWSSHKINLFHYEEEKILQSIKQIKVALN